MEEGLIICGMVRIYVEVNDRRTYRGGRLMEGEGKAERREQQDAGSLRHYVRLSGVPSPNASNHIWKRRTGRTEAQHSRPIGRLSASAIIRSICLLILGD